MPINLHHEVHGEQRPGTAPLLLVHGGGSTIDTNFGALLPVLAATRRVVAVELQGHGHTPSTDRPPSFENSAADLAALLDRLALGPVDVLGFSNGGQTAMRLAIARPADAAIGWPDALYRRIGHPVGAMARVVGWCETRWNASGAPDTKRQLLGIATLTVVVGVTGIIAGTLQLAAHAWLDAYAWAAIGLLAAPGLAQRSLDDHVVPVATALSAGDLSLARAAVGRIVGRDVDRLDDAGVARAAIESLAESFCDGVVAPVFWLIVAGLPGIWMYKAINTADSLIGHREPRWRAFGWAAARTDDVVNLIPARLSGIALCLAAPGGWGTMWRDARRHASPNAGWPEAAMAGALGVRLAGPVSYDGQSRIKPWIGEGRTATVNDLRRALVIYRRACLLLWIAAGGLAWAL